MRISDWSSDVCSSDLRWFPWAIGSSGPLYLLQNIRADMKGMGFQFDDVVLHTMRNTCASRLADNGIDLVSLRDWLGHSELKITAGRYEIGRPTSELQSLIRISYADLCLKQKKNQ